MKTILAASAAFAMLGVASVGTPASAAFAPEGATQPTTTAPAGVMLAHGRHQACRGYGGWHLHWWDGYHWQRRGCAPYGGGGYGGGY